VVHRHGAASPREREGTAKSARTSGEEESEKRHESRERASEGKQERGARRAKVSSDGKTYMYIGVHKRGHRGRGYGVLSPV